MNYIILEDTPMKKTIALLLALLCAMGSFVACGNDEKEKESKEKGR